MWNDVTDSEVTGLLVGEYEVRYKASETSFASEVARVEVVEVEKLPCEWLAGGTPSAGATYLNYVDGKYIGFNESATTTYSYCTDIFDWAKGTMPQQVSWRRLCYADGKIVAVSNPYNASSYTAYSLDGVSWTTKTLSTTKFYGDLCYGNGVFAGPGAYAKNIYSADGINWSIGALPQNVFCGGSCFGNGKFVNVCYKSGTGTSAYTDICFYSTDGVNWAESTMPVALNWCALCYGDGKFIALAYESSVMAYSTDGINWEIGAMPESLRWARICYGGGEFVAVGDGLNGADNSIVAHSTDGVNWYTKEMPVAANWGGVCYDEDKDRFVAISTYPTSSAYLQH